MSSGALTFGSLARLSDYRSNLASNAKQGLSKAGQPMSFVSARIPSGNVDARTEQALQWSGLKPASAKNADPQSKLFAGSNAFSEQIAAPNYAAPDLDFTYSLASIKGILAYRDALLSRNSTSGDQPSGQNLSEKS